MNRTSRILLSVLAAAIAFVIGAPAASACPSAQTPFSAAAESAVSDAVICLVNAERTARDLPALSGDADLKEAALGHSRDMAANNYFSHNSRDGTKFSSRLTSAGYDWIYAGENIAAGYSTAEDVMKGWMASEGHCVNILSGGFTEVGVGIAAGPGRFGIYWTQDFGRERGSATSSDAASGCPFKELVVSDGASSCAVGKVRIRSLRRLSKGRLRVSVRREGAGCCPKFSFTAKRGARRATTRRRICGNSFVVVLKLPRGHGKIVVTARAAGGEAAARRSLGR